MANLSSTGAAASGKTYPHQYPYETPSLVGGVVQHVLISATTQINILRIVEETGSANVGDIAAALVGHPDPVAAILVMAELNLLVVDIRGVVDAHTMVRRGTPKPDPQGPTAPFPISPVPIGTSSAAPVVAPVLPEGIERLVVSPFTAALTLVQGGARRELLRLSDLRRPGVYGLMSRDHLYVGTGSDVAQRVATGQQPIAGIDTLFVLTDAQNNLTADDAKVAERLLWNRCAASGERSLANGGPDGAAVDAQRFSEIDSLVAAACLALRHHGLLFVDGSARGVLAGPRQEPGRLAPLRHLDQMPAGEVLELTFSDGLVALAARQSDEHWLLLQGSDVRIETAASANASVRFLRSAWLHAGLLDLAPDGRSYQAKRDLVFGSGTAVAQFVTGAKGRTLSCWQPIAPGGGLDPDTARLIAA